MKKTILLLIAVSLLASCRSKIELIGSLNMVSNRNVSTKENYVQIKSYANTANHELRRNKAKTIDEALNNTLRNNPGGEFLMNAKIYVIGSDYAISGDVWGLAENQNFKGYKKGDKVTFKDNLTTYTGTITDFKNDRECYVKCEDGKVRAAFYDELKKAE